MDNLFGRSAVFKSALLITGSTYFTFSVGLIVSMLIARSLGPREFGHYAYLVWLSGSLTFLLCNGLNLSALRFVSECLGRNDMQEARNVHGMLSRWFLASIGLVSAVFLVAYPWLQPTGWSKPAWVFAAAALGAAIAKSHYMFEASVAKGCGRFEIDAHTINLTSLANLIGVALLVATRQPLEAYILAFIAISIGHSVVTRILTRRAGIVMSHGAVSEELGGRIKTQYFWTTALFLVFAFSNKSVENLFLNSYVGPEAVGWFAIGAAMTRGGVEMLSAGLSAVLMPIMSHAVGSKDVDRTNRIFTDAVRYYFFLGLLLAGVGVLWAGPVITVLYGPEFDPAILGLQVMVLIGAMTMVEGATSSLLMTTDRQSLRVGLAVAVVALTLAAAALLVPPYGFEGALAAHAIARTIIFAVGLIVTLRILDIDLPLAELARMLAAAAIGAALALALLLVSTGLAAQFIAGIAYGAGCLLGSLAIRVWTTDDVLLLSPLAERLPRLRGIEAWMLRRARAHQAPGRPLS